MNSEANTTGAVFGAKETVGNKKHLLWLDMAKGIAIALVILGHCLDYDNPLRDLIYSFHMPIFFVLAGFTMRPKKRSVVLKTSFERLLVPYLLVCAVLFFFAFVPPSSIDPDLDTQKDWLTVLCEIFYASGCEYTVGSMTLQAIGAIWFLPCLFVARLLYNEVLIQSAKTKRFELLVSTVAVVAIAFAGFKIGEQVRLAWSIDTAMVALLYLHIGQLAKRFDFTRLPLLVWVALALIWFHGFESGTDIAVRTYLEKPMDLVYSTAASLVVMRICALLESCGTHKNAFSRAMAWINGWIAKLGVASLTVLCVHRIESAVFNWQKIMEFFAPGVWSWDVTLQGLYQFGLRFALVICITAVYLTAKKMIKGRIADIGSRS